CGGTWNIRNRQRLLSSLPPLSSHTHLIRTLCQGERTIHFRGSIKQENKAILRRSYPADTWCHSG
ncbi:unnamed protein product, partial [Ectocarpus sp. 8 AP-2014]